MARRFHWFPREMTSAKRAQNQSCRVASSNQKHHPDLGSDALSEWNICARFLGVISQGNQRGCREMSDVF